MLNVVNLANKFDKFSDHWHPRILGALNDSEIKLVKLLLLEPKNTLNTGTVQNERTAQAEWI